MDGATSPGSRLGVAGPVGAENPSNAETPAAGSRPAAAALDVELEAALPEDALTAAATIPIGRNEGTIGAPGSKGHSRSVTRTVSANGSPHALD